MKYYSSLDCFSTIWKCKSHSKLKKERVKSPSSLRLPIPGRDNGSQKSRPRAAKGVPPGWGWSEVHVPWSHSRLPESETLGVRPRVLCFNKPLRRCWYVQTLHLSIFICIWVTVALIKEDILIGKSVLENKILHFLRSSQVSSMLLNPKGCPLSSKDLRISYWLIRD